MLTSILAALCVTCEPAALRKILSAPMTRPAPGRSDSSAAAFYEFPSTFPRISLKFWPLAVSQQPVVKAGRPLMTHIGPGHAS